MQLDELQCLARAAQVQGLVRHEPQRLHGEVGAARVILGAAGGVQGEGPQPPSGVVPLHVIGQPSRDTGQVRGGHQQAGTDPRRAGGVLQPAHLLQLRDSRRAIQSTAVGIGRTAETVRDRLDRVDVGRTDPRPGDRWVVIRQQRAQPCELRVQT
ncbi:MAG: hypothetical protein ACRDRH_18805 [Pseudonocardia sp.]